MLVADRTLMCPFCLIDPNSFPTPGKGETRPGTVTLCGSWALVASHTLKKLRSTGRGYGRQKWLNGSRSVMWNACVNAAQRV